MSAGRGGAPPPTATTCSPLISTQPGSSTASPVATAAPPSSVVGCGPAHLGARASRSPTSRRRVPITCTSCTVSPSSATSKITQHGPKAASHTTRRWEAHHDNPRTRDLAGRLSARKDRALMSLDSLITEAPTPGPKRSDAMPVAEILAVVNDRGPHGGRRRYESRYDIARASRCHCGGLRGGRRLIYLGAGQRTHRVAQYGGVPPTFGARTRPWSSSTRRRVAGGVGSTPSRCRGRRGRPTYRGG